jgi:hypothetical protein
MNPNLTDVAWDLWDKGINVFPLAYGSKQPPSGFAWKPLMTRRVTEDEMREWFCTDEPRNIAMLCGTKSGVIVADFDSREDARRAYSVLPNTPAMQRTPRGGGHFIFALPEGMEIPCAVKTTVLGITADIRSEGGYIVVSPSIGQNGKPYEWVNWPWNLSDLPTFDPAWLPQATAKRPVTRGAIPDVIGYLSKVESIQGQNGSAGLVRACALLAENGYTEAQAMAALLEWNRCSTVNPPWSVNELARACSRIYARTRQAAR